MYARGTQYKNDIDIGHGFIAKAIDRSYLEKHDLLGKGLLNFVNDLCLIVDEKKDQLLLDEWNCLEYSSALS